MDLRLKGLQALDPLNVPLPNGTEVTCRVERQVHGRMVPQGSIGRVVETLGEQVVVLIPGVGRATYSRQELTPRKAGQLRFAQRRAMAWDALLPNVVLETVVGSRAWGLAEEGSDTDRRGVVVWPFAWTTALQRPAQDAVSLDGSQTFWEVGKMLEQALRADPNTLEMLFVDGATARDELGQWILEARHACVSQLIHASFGRYALAQLKKLSQSMRLAEHRTLILEWLRQDPTLPLDQVATRLADATLPNHADRSDAVLQSKTWVKQLYRSLHDQGLITANDFPSLVAFAVAGQDGLELPRELRPKNAYNLLRLILVAIHWLRTGEPNFVATGAWRSRLLSIKRGEVPLDQVLLEAESLTAELDEAHRSSPLPRHPRVEEVDALLRRIRAEVARRHLAAIPGPFGQDAAPLSLASWDASEEVQP